LEKKPQVPANAAWPCVTLCLNASGNLRRSQGGSHTTRFLNISIFSISNSMGLPERGF